MVTKTVFIFGPAKQDWSYRAADRLKLPLLRKDFPKKAKVGFLGQHYISKVSPFCSMAENTFFIELDNSDSLLFKLAMENYLKENTVLKGTARFHRMKINLGIIQDELGNLTKELYFCETLKKYSETLSLGPIKKEIGKRRSNIRKKLKAYKDSITLLK